MKIYMSTYQAYILMHINIYKIKSPYTWYIYLCYIPNIYTIYFVLLVISFFNNVANQNGRFKLSEKMSKLIQNLHTLEVGNHHDFTLFIE